MKNSDKREDSKRTIPVNGLEVLLHFIFLQRFCLSVLQRSSLGGHLLGECTGGLHVTIMSQKLSD